MIEPYSVACLQANTRRIRSAAEGAVIGPANVHRFVELARWAKRRAPDLRLVVLPEFSVTGTGRKPVADWTEIAPGFPGPLSDILADGARELGVYFSLATYEYDPDWPGRFWNTALIVSPDGEIILKYRKINDVNHGQTIDTTPGDVWTQYVARYGLDGVYPVVDTPIGKLAAMICYDTTWPEVARGLALNGAEVLVHPTSEPHGGAFGGPQTTWDEARRCRAFENLAYLVSANSGETLAPIGDGFLGDPELLFQQGTAPEVTPMHFSRGYSVVIDYQGRKLAWSTSPGESVVIGRVDIEALRRRRLETGGGQLGQLQPERYADTYRIAARCAYVNDRWLEAPIQTREEGGRATLDAIQRLRDEGVVRSSQDGADARFTVAVIQPEIAMGDAWDAGQAVAGIRGLIEEAVAGSGADLIVAPNLFLQGLPDDGALDDKRLAVVERAGALARELRVWLAGGVLERLDGAVVNAGLLWAPDGRVVLRQRKLHRFDPMIPAAATLRAGDELFPVVETPFGRVGLIVGEDVQVPEVVRALAMRGAEVLLHVAFEHYDEQWEMWQSAKRARAWESCAVLVSANYGALRGADVPAFPGPGHSQVIDHTGEVLAVIDGAGASWMPVEVDLRSEQFRRNGINMNFLAQLRGGVYLPMYERVAVPVRAREG